MKFERFKTVFVLPGGYRVWGARTVSHSFVVTDDGDGWSASVQDATANRGRTELLGSGFGAFRTRKEAEQACRDYWQRVRQ